MSAPVPLEPWLAYGEALARFLFLNWGGQATFLLAAGLLLSRLPRLSASVRHAVLAAALAASALCPLLAGATAPLHYRVDPAPPLSTAAGERAGGEQLRPRAQLDRPAAGGRTSNGVSPAELAVRHAGLLAALLWLLGVAARLVWLGTGVRTVRGWVRRAVPVHRHRVYDACGCALADVRVLESDAVPVPCVAGFLAPCVLLPEGLMETLEPRTLRHVLFHEEAHVRRGDALVLLGAEICGALLFWHPFAWAARRELEVAAEDACDAHVLSRGEADMGYARTLLAMAREVDRSRRHPALCPIGASGRDLTRRVRRILARRSAPSAALGAVSAAGLTAVCAGAVLAQVGEAPAPPRTPAPRAAQRRSAVRPARTLRSGKPFRVARVFLPPREQSSAPVVVSVPAAGLGAAPDLLRLDALEGWQGEARDALPREDRVIVFVLDSTPAMRPFQEGARREIVELARALAPEDRFNVVAFSGETVQLSSKPVYPTEESFAQLDTWLAGLPEGDGASVEGAMSRALSVPDVTSVVLVSDTESRTPWQDRRLSELIARESRAAVQMVTVTFEAPAAAAGPDWPSVPAPRPEEIQAERGRPLAAP
ncbi:MAG: M56 family metallopeptidase [Armatimonadota bacterium]